MYRGLSPKYLLLLLLLPLPSPNNQFKCPSRGCPFLGRPVYLSLYISSHALFFLSPLSCFLFLVCFFPFASNRCCALLHRLVGAISGDSLLCCTSALLVGSVCGYSDANVLAAAGRVYRLVSRKALARGLARNKLALSGHVVYLWVLGGACVSPLSKFGIGSARAFACSTPHAMPCHAHTRTQASKKEGKRASKPAQVPFH